MIAIEQTFISLFGGIGGFDLAFTRQGWKCVFYNDWDKYAVQTYNKNFGNNYEPQDVTKLDANTIPDHTLLCAGFPCQSFSLAGKRKGFEDSRGTMFFEICRIAKAKRTPILLLENVKGLLSHDEGKTFCTILKCLDELGYDAEWQVLNSKHFSIPQNRERVFIIANLRGTPRPKIFPITEDAGEVSEVFRDEGVENGQEGRLMFDVYNKNLRGECPTLTEPHHNSIRVVSPAITTENAHGYGNNVTVGQTEAIARCLDANMHKGVSPEGFFEKGERNLVFQLHNANEWRDFEHSPTLSQAMGTGGNNVPMVLQKHREGVREYGDGFCPTIAKDMGDNLPVVVSHSPLSGNPLKGGTGVLASDEHAFTLDSTPHIVAQRGRENGQEFEPNTESNSLTGVQKDNLVYAPTMRANHHNTADVHFIPEEQNKLRRLTPLECERLQGFPDGWTAGVSDTQRYKQCGNSVTVNVIEAIAKKLNEALGVEAKK